jgi:hypothetical protein
LGLGSGGQALGGQLLAGVDDRASGSGPSDGSGQVGGAEIQFGVSTQVLQHQSPQLPRGQPNPLTIADATGGGAGVVHG